MKFCPICKSTLYRKNNYKCFKCEGDFTSTENTNSVETTDTKLHSFPFEIGKYYEQQFIREKCHAHPQWGISYNSIGGYWVVIKNKKSKSNIYYDRMSKEGLYHYTGQGLTGDQKIESGNNYGLKNAKSQGQKIHLFWQDNMGSNHKYLGEVEVNSVVEEEQMGQNNRPRKVFVFSFQTL